MNITRESIEERKNVIQNDIIIARDRIIEYDKKKVEDVALINALTGAFQQCDAFLNDLDDEKPEMASDDGNDSIAVS